jgi:O-antigen/teichoic acid export membrane protein
MVFTGIVAARTLGVEDRGHLALILLLPIIVALLGVAVPVTATYHIARAPDSARDVVARLRRPALTQTTVLTGVHLVVLAVLLSSRDQDVRMAGLVTIPAVPLLLAQQYGLSILQGRQAFLPYNVLRVGPAAFYAVGTLAIVALGDGSVTAFALSWVVGLGISALLTCVVAARSLPARLDDPRVPSSRTMMAFGWRSFLGTGSPIEYFQIDQAIVAFFLAPEALGIYVVAMSLTNLVRFIGQSVGIVAYPRVAAREGHEQRVLLWRFVGVAAIACGTIVLVLEATATWLVPFLFGESFDAAVAVTRVLLVAAFLFAIRRVLTEGARGAGQASAGSVAEVVSLVVLAATAPVLVPSHGIEGLAWAMVIAGGLSLATLALAVARAGRRPASRLLVGFR